MLKVGMEFDTAIDYLLDGESISFLKGGESFTVFPEIVTVNDTTGEKSSHSIKALKDTFFNVSPKN